MEVNKSWKRDGQDGRNRRDIISELTMWWWCLTEKNIKRFYMQEGSIQRREMKKKENFYYACIYDVLLDSRTQEEKKGPQSFPSQNSTITQPATEQNSTIT
jgi:hypothetical protein